jgi:hypothetical protein
MFFHWQNLNESKRDVLHGRAWWNFGSATRVAPRWKQVMFSWRIGPWTWIGLIFTHGADELDYGVSFGLGFLQLYLQLSGFRDYKAMRRCSFGHDTGIRLYGEMLTLQWNNDDSETSISTVGDRRVQRDKHGWRCSGLLLDVFLGRAVHSSRTLSYNGSFIHMPEGVYACTVKLHRDTWKRPRWPRPLRIDRATVEIPVGVPIPGKGENSWDCGEDKIYSSTMPAATVKVAVENVQNAATERRLKYGGPRWKPEGVK